MIMIGLPNVCKIFLNFKIIIIIKKKANSLKRVTLVKFLKKINRQEADIKSNINKDVFSRLWIRKLCEHICAFDKSDLFHAVSSKQRQKSFFNLTNLQFNGRQIFMLNKEKKTTELLNIKPKINKFLNINFNYSKYNIIYNEKTHYIHTFDFRYVDKYLTLYDKNAMVNKKVMKMKYVFFI